MLKVLQGYNKIKYVIITKKIKFISYMKTLSAEHFGDNISIILFCTVNSQTYQEYTCS